MARYRITLTLEEEQRQLLVIALVQLALARPGWVRLIRDLASEQLDARVMYDELLKLRRCEQLGEPCPEHQIAGAMDALDRFKREGNEDAEARTEAT